MRLTFMEFSVYWDPRLIPAKCFTPMDYTAPPSREKDNVQIIDILRFFVNYINNDNLGQIANAHLATADFSPLGARDGKCIRLAQKHSEAVGNININAILIIYLTHIRFP